MARIYIVPISQFQPGRLGEARRWEEERDRLLRRKEQLESELARMPAKLEECDRGMAAASLERWRIA